MLHRLPPLNSLRAFEAAARLLSFKKAADELAVTPTAVSHQIRLLEDYLGTILFRRLTRALELTPEGAAMQPKISEGFSTLAAAVAAVSHQGSSNVVTVCAPPSFATRWLIPRLGHFARIHPEVELQLTSSLLAVDSREQQPSGRDGLVADNAKNYDLIIRFGRGLYPGYAVELLFSPAYVPVCSPVLLKGKHALQTPDDLRWHTLIHDATIPDFDDRPGWVQWLELAGVKSLADQERGPRYADAVLAVEAAIAGQGVALAARPLVSADLAARRLVMPFPFFIPSRYAYYLTRSALSAERPAVSALCSWLGDEATRERMAPPDGHTGVDRPRRRKRETARGAAKSPT